MTPRTKTIYSIIRRNGRNVWKRIGIAFPSEDGSENLVFDELPTDPQMTIQVRESEPDGVNEVDAEIP